MSAPVVRLLDARADGLGHRALRAWAHEVGDALGRPFVTRSYRYPYALVAAHDAEVGVDIERLQAVDEAFAVSISTPDEREALAEEAGEDLSAWAIALWSGKEALAKALGDAVAYDPRRLASPVRWPNLRAGSWRAAPLPVPARHTGWLCWRTAGPHPQGEGATTMQQRYFEPIVRRLASEPAPPRTTETPECPDSGIPAGGDPSQYGAVPPPAPPLPRR